MGAGAGEPTVAAFGVYPLMSVTPAGRSSNSAALRALADSRARALAPLIAEIRKGGAATPSEIAQKLNQHGSTTHRGNLWCLTQVQRLLKRLDKL
jgi:hypothetical protein